jgi:hypothetical protein
MNLCRDQLSATAKREADAVRLEWPCRNNFKSILARSLELITAFDEAVGLASSY